MRMFMTFFKEFTTQSNTAFNFGTRLIVFKGLSTLNTRNDFIVDRFCPAPFFTPLKENITELDNTFIKKVFYYLDVSN